MSIFRNITANSMLEGHASHTVTMENTPDLADRQGIVISVNTLAGDVDRSVTVSLADARELAGWLIEHAVTGEPFCCPRADAHLPHADCPGQG